MAIAIPIIASMTGASAAIGTALGISAGMATAGIGLLTTVTGIGAKIDKAAAKVFGKDLVMGANLLGGFAMAAGWNPAEGLKLGDLTIGGASGSGGVSPGGSIDGLGASIDAAGGVDAVANGGISGIDGATGAATTVAAPGQNAMRVAEIKGYENIAGSATRAAIDPGAAPKGVLDQVGQWFDKQPERVKAALITVGGNAVAGAAQGYASAKEQDKLIEEQKRRERLFKSGSGTNFTYQPGVLAQTRG